MNPGKIQFCKEVLAKSIFFESLTSADLDKLLAFTRIQQYKGNESIFVKGDPGGQLYAVLSGTVRINTLSEEGKEITLAMLGEGELFGELTLFEDKERTASANMHIKGELLIMDHRRFLAFLEAKPKVAIKLIKTLVRRLRETDEFLEDALFLNLPVRLAKKIMVLIENHGEENQDGILLNIKFSQTEIGNLVNSTRESINKLIREWKASGIISFENGYITILDIDALEDISYGITEL